jgi:group I intron endonuclease
VKEVCKEDKGKSGVYKITNLVNHKIYIGQSIDLWTRINEGYLQKLPKQKSHNRYIQRSWNKYGSENFIFEVVEYCDVEDLNPRETYWIEYYDSANKYKGYNIDKIGGSSRGRKVSEETKRKISKATKGENNPNYGKPLSEEHKKALSEHRSIPVVQLDLDGNFIREWKSALEVSDYYNVARNSISTVLRKKTTTSCGSIWLYKDEYDKGDFNIEKHYERDSLKKAVIQLTLDGKFIKEYRTMTQASQETNTFNINNVCNGTQKSANGFIWMYKEEYEKYGFIKERYQRVKRTSGIVQLSLEGEFMKLWDNAEVAAKFLQCSDKSIRASCKGRINTSNGFIWLYEEDYNKNGLNEERLINQGKSLKAVVQLSLNGEYINQFRSIKEAYDELGIIASNITAVCKGKNKTAGGFKWVYLDEYKKNQ